MANGSPFKLVPVSFETSLIFFKCFLTFWHDKVLQFFPYLDLEISHFPMEPWLLSVEDGCIETKILAVGLLTATRVKLLQGHLRGQSWEMFLHTHKQMCVHGHMQAIHTIHILTFYPCISISIYIYMHVDVLEPTSSYLWLQF